MNNHTHEPYAPDIIDFQIDRVLKASPENPLTNQNEQFLQQLHETYLLGKEYDLSLKRVQQRLETRQTSAAGDQVARAHSASGLTRWLVRSPLDIHGWRRSWSMLTAAALCLLLIGGMLAFYRVYNNGCGSQTCSTLPPTRVPRPTPNPVLPQFYAVTQLSGDIHLKDHGDQILYRFEPATGQTLWQFVIHAYRHTNSDGSISGGSEPINAQEASGMLYVRGTGTDGDYIYALNATTGMQVWSLKCGDPNTSLFCDTPVIVNGVLYLVQDNLQMNVASTLTALNLFNGHRLWQKPYAFTLGIVATAGQILFAESEDMSSWEIYAIDALTGSIIWHTHRTVAADESAGYWQVANGKLYEISWVSPSANLQTGVSHLVAFDMTNGNVDWTKTLRDTDPQMILVRGVLYVGTSSDTFSSSYSTLYALQASDGSLIWQKHINDTCEDLAVIDGTLYMIVNGDGGSGVALYAWRASDGEPLWEYPAGPQMTLNGIAADANAVYIGYFAGWTSTISLSNQVLVLNKLTGRLTKIITIGTDGASRAGTTSVFSLLPSAG